jgi:ParB-like chromosome segregation protein Spo0J
MSEISVVETRKAKTDDLKPNSWNPNEMSEGTFEFLKKRIEDVGFRDPVEIREDGTIKDGEHRWRAARELGIKEIPVVVTEDKSLDDEKIETINANLIKGEFNPIKYGRLLQDLTQRIDLEDLKKKIVTEGAEMETLIRMVRELPDIDEEKLKKMLKSNPIFSLTLQFASKDEFDEVQKRLKQIMIDYQVPRMEDAMLVFVRKGNIVL